MNINSIDLNLLVAFHALMTYRNVTKAGQSIGRSQPAMSNALSRLRIVLNDQLLVKSGSLMKPTPRAMELLPEIQEALQQIEKAISGNLEFEPSKARLIFTIAMVESAAFVLLPRLSSFIIKKAPQINLNIIGVTNIQGIELMKAGRCDMAIEIPPKNLPSNTDSLPLYKEQFVCMTRTNHPIRDNKITLNSYLSYDHVAVHPSEEADSSVDKALKLIGKTRRVAIKTPYSLLVNLMLNKSNLIATLPKRNAIHFSKQSDLSTAIVPFKISNFHIHLLWDKRFNNDPAHAWMRASIENISRIV